MLPDELQAMLEKFYRPTHIVKDEDDSYLIVCPMDADIQQRSLENRLAKHGWRVVSFGVLVADGTQHMRIEEMPGDE